MQKQTPLPKTKKKSATLRDVTIATLRAKGQTCREIAKEVHLSHMQVSRELKKESIKDKLEEMLSYYATYTEDVAKGFMELVLDDDKDVRSKNIAEYHKVMGINTPHAPIFIQQIFQDNRVQILSPHVQQLLTDHFTQTIEGEVIEDTSQVTKEGE